MFGNPHRIYGSETSKAAKVSVTLKRFLGYFKPFWLAYVFVLAMMLIGTWAQVEAPKLMGQAVDCFLSPVGANAFAAEDSPFAAFVQAGNQGAESNCSYASVQADWTAEDYLAGLGGIALRILGLFALGAVATGLMFYFMVWSGQHVIKTFCQGIRYEFARNCESTTTCLTYPCCRCISSYL